jgi:hypothetical protein
VKWGWVAVLAWWRFLLAGPWYTTERERKDLDDLMNF